MTDDSDFQAMFLAECEELIGQLCDSLAELPDGGREQLNTAFRAVHSIKGGAAAFGFEELISFAHNFEDLMARLREQDEMPSEDVLEQLRRGGDLLEVMIERAEKGTDGPLPDWADAVMQGFGMDAAPSNEPAAPAPPDPEPGAPQGDVAENEEADDLKIEIKPNAQFFLAGHEPLKLLRAAAAVGLSHAEVVGQVPPLAEVDPSLCPFTWVLSFENTDAATLRDFFSVYDLSMEIRGLPAAPLDPTPQHDPMPAKSGDNPPKRRVRTLRVDLDRIDRIVNLVGEIVIAQAALAQSGRDLPSDSSSAITIEELSRLVREMQDSVMSIRAQPIKTVFSRMPRVVRDLSENLKREVRLEVEGEQTEVDTTVIEELVEPLTHALRNAMDHGIETPQERMDAGKTRHGTITLSARHRGEQVIITISDDGRGIPRDKVLSKALSKGLIENPEGLSPEDIDNLVFLPGFSTSNSVSEVSGRGVGMDVVKRKITGLGGRCRIHSTPGEGVSVVLTLPLTLAVLDGMIVTIGGNKFVVPLAGIIEAIRFDPAELQKMPTGHMILARRGQHLPMFDLSEQLGREDIAREPPSMALIVDTENRGIVALMVDSLQGQRQVVLKSLEANYRQVHGVSGATILGDGKVALILDVATLIFPPFLPSEADLEEVA